MKTIVPDYPEDWLGKYVICNEHGTHGAVYVWNQNAYPNLYETAEDAEEMIREDLKGWYFPIQIRREKEGRCWPYLLEK